MKVNGDIPEASVYALKALKARQQEAKDNQFKERSKRRLSKIVSTKLKTAFVGAIASAEDVFGFLCGHGEVTPEEMTEEQRSWYNLF